MNDVKDVVNWIEEWFNLWPKGIKSGGYYIRTDIGSCLRKMTDFVKDNPQYNKNIILSATKNYLSDRSKQRYLYTKLAPYFIKKDGVSLLDGFCQAIMDSDTDTDAPMEYLNDI